MIENRINIMDTPTAAPAQPPQEAKVIYASVTERFVALLIDYGVIFLPCQFAAWLWLKIWKPELELWQSQSADFSAI